MKKTILLVCEGRQHLEVAKKFARILNKNKYNTTLFWPHVFENNLNLDIFDNLSNDVTLIPGYLKEISLIIFFTLDSSTSGLVSLTICYIAEKTKTPFLLFQHGFLQPGLNFDTSIKEVGRISTGSDISKSIYRFSDSIKYFGDNGIGYPLLDSKIKRINHFIPHNANILITTNFNWSIYTNECVVSFLRAIRTLKEEYPNLNFLHKPHPSENIALIKDRVSLYLNDFNIKQSNFDEISKAIYWADLVITTPSTTILDTISLNRLPLIFSPPIFDQYLKEFNNIKFFSSDSLLRIFNDHYTSSKIFNIPCDYQFNENKFIKLIEDSTKKSDSFSMTLENYLTYLSLIKN